MFITFEGPEGAGKSSVIAALSARLVAQSEQILLSREPGSGEFGLKIRDILLNQQAMTHQAELFLFLADRSEHVATILEPALKSGKLVLCDRFIDSTVVYQGYARGGDLGLLRQLNDLATGGLKPDLTLLLDLAPEIGLGRIKDKDRLDKEPLYFHQKVREGFLAEAELDPKRWAVIDAAQEPSVVEDACAAAMQERLGISL